MESALDRYEAEEHGASRTNEEGDTRQ